MNNAEQGHSKLLSERPGSLTGDALPVSVGSGLGSPFSSGSHS